MSREIRKKIIDQDPESEPVIDDVPQNPMPEESFQEVLSSFEDDLSGNTEKDGGFSLDEFHMEDIDPPVSETPNEASEAENPPDQADEQKLKRAKRRIALNKLLIVALPCLVLMASAGWWILHNRPEEPKPKRQIVTMIKHPISIPHYQEELDFFVLTTPQQGRSIVMMSLELEFHHPDKYQRFRKETTLFRDTIYRFLMNRQPAKNSLKEWQRIVQNDLSPYLEASPAAGQVDVVRVSRLERL